MADLGIKIIIDGINNASNAVKSAARDLQDLEKQAQPLNTVLNELSSTMAQVGVVAVGMGVALGGVFALATKAASDFQYGIANVESILQINAKSTQALAADIGMLSAQAKQLGLETQFSAVQAADAMTELVRAGYDANKTFSTMPAVLDLAAASGMGLARTSEALVNILNPFKLSADQAGVAANTLAVIAASSSLTFSDLAESMKYAAPAAQAAGLSLNETAAIMGALGDAGIKASMGGTAVRGMMTDLAAPTRKATETLHQMNVEIVKDTQGNFDFLATMEALGKANMTLGQATQIFGVHQATAALVVAQSSDKIKTLTDATFTQTDALTKMRETLEKSLNRAFVILTSSVEGLAIALGSPLLEPLAALVNKISSVLNSISQWLTAHETLTKYIGIAVAAISAYLIVIGSLALAVAAAAKGYQLWVQAHALLATAKTALTSAATASVAATTAETAAVAAQTAALEARTVAARAAMAAAAGSTAGIGAQLAASGAAIATTATAASGVLATLVAWGSKLLGLAGKFAGPIAGIAAVTVATETATSQTSWWIKAIEGVGAAITLLAPGWFKLIGLGITGIGELLKWLTGQAGDAGKGMQGSMQGAGVSAEEASKKIGLIKEELKKGSLSAEEAATKIYQIQTASANASMAAANAGTSMKGLDSATQSMVESAVAAGMSWKEFKEQYVETFKRQPPDEVSSAFYRLRVAGVEAGEKTAAALALVGTETGKVGEGIGVAKKSAEELKKEASDMTASLNWAFQELHRVSALAFDALTKSIDTSTTEWKRALKNSAVDSEVVAVAFDKMGSDVGKSLTTLNQVANERLSQLADRLSKAIQAGGSQKEIEAIQKGIEKFGEQAAKVYEKMAKDAGNALKELQDKYDDVVKKMSQLTADMAKQELKDIDIIAKARKTSAETDMNDHQKYAARKVEIWDREMEIQRLIAEGGEDNLKRARVLVEENIRETNSLKEVKRNYIDMFPEEADRINEEIRALEGVRNKTQEQKDEIKSLKELLKDKVTLVDAEGAAVERNKILNQSENDLQVIRNKQEDEKSAELEKQRKTLEDQIERMKQQQREAELLLTNFRQAIAITLDTSGATLQMETLFKDRVIKATIEITGDATQTKQDGGLISQVFALGGRVRRAIKAAIGQFVPGGYGGGDIVPALLEPGEFVWRKEVVSAIGPNFFDRINRAGASAASVVSSIPAHFAEGGGVSFVPASSPTSWTYNLDNLIGGMNAQVSQNKLSLDFSSLGDSVSRLESVMAGMGDSVVSQDRLVNSIAGRLEKTFGNMKSKVKVEVKDGMGTASVDML